MRTDCPNCGAKLHLQREGLSAPPPSQVRCWMCTSMVTLVAPSKDAGPPTITSAPGNNSKGSRIVGVLKSQTTSLALPRDKVIKVSVVEGPSQGLEYELSRPLMTIGRAGGEADIKVDDPEVSRLHCAIEVRSDAILLHDLNSRNGTYLNDSRVVAARLEHTARFRIGSSLLQ